MVFLREARRNKQMTETDVSSAAHITQQYYNFIENGKRRPSVDVAKRIAAVLGFDWTRFFDDDKSA